MISTSFYQKADLERYLMPDIKEADYEELLRAIWDPLVEKGLSFVTKTDSDKIIGCALNFDARDEPEVEIHSKLTVIFEFLEFVEGAVRLVFFFFNKNLFRKPSRSRTIINIFCLET